MQSYFKYLKTQHFCLSFSINLFFMPVELHTQSIIMLKDSLLSSSLLHSWRDSVPEQPSCNTAT